MLLEISLNSSASFQNLQKFQKFRLRSPGTGNSTNSSLDLHCSVMSVKAAGEEFFCFCLLLVFCFLT